MCWVFFNLGGGVVFALFFLVDSRPLKRRCSKWNKSCQFGDGYIRVKCFQIFLLLNVCKLLYGGDFS